MIRNARDGPRRTFGDSYEQRILRDALVMMLPGALLMLCLLFLLPAGSSMPWLLLAGVALALTLLLAYRLKRNITDPLNTLANLFAALREGDYSVRGARATEKGIVGAVVRDVNLLAEALRNQRLKVEETTAFIDKLVNAIDISVLIFDDGGRLRLANDAAAALLGISGQDCGAHSASSLGLAACMGIVRPTVFSRSFHGGAGVYEVRRHRFRQNGLSHDLLVITDISRVLREQERHAWLGLIRVFSHELNNSLAPIKSMADTLVVLARRDPVPEDWLDDLTEGLHVIGHRAEALNRFMLGYAKLAKLPEPRRVTVNVALLAERVVRLVSSSGVRLRHGPPIEWPLDPEQIEQALINVIKNAGEAAGGNGDVSVHWDLHRGRLRFMVVDDGPGIMAPDNLFVPFYTTKPNGSGIGLLLVRQIVEGHGGRFELRNRDGAPGCVASIELPSGTGSGVGEDQRTG